MKHGNTSFTRALLASAALCTLAFGAIGSAAAGDTTQEILAEPSSATLSAISRPEANAAMPQQSPYAPLTIREAQATTGTATPVLEQQPAPAPVVAVQPQPVKAPAPAPAVAQVAKPAPERINIDTLLEKRYGKLSDDLKADLKKNGGEAYVTNSYTPVAPAQYQPAGQQAAGSLKAIKNSAINQGAESYDAQEPDIAAAEEHFGEATKVEAAGISDLLAQAYANSPALRAKREALRQQYEEVNQAAAYKRPNISAGAGVTTQYSKTDPGSDDTFVTKDISITGTQYLYRGGRTLSEIDRQISLSKAAQAEYDSAVQAVMLNVLTAAMDIQRDRATIALQEKNLEVLSRQLEAAQKGFEVGELTRTDVAQAQARVSGGQADLVTAKANYSNSLARFKQYAGMDGDELDLDLKNGTPKLPSSLDKAKRYAKVRHPDIMAAKLAGEAAESAVRTAKGALLPTVSLNGEVSDAWDATAALDESRDASIGLRATMPLYDGGASRSGIRQAKMAGFEKKNALADTEKTVEKQLASAWNDYSAGKAAITAYENQVSAAQMARDGVYKEREVGSRTVLDTLNADAELLDAAVGLVQARRNEVVAAYGVLAAIGGLTAGRLGIAEPVQADTYMEGVEGTLFGTDAEPLQ